MKWRGLDLSQEPKIYTTECVQFGDSPAAAITAIAIKETANSYQHIDPDAADKIKNDSYVDDFATGALTPDAAETLKKNITEILAKGGFHIKGFVTSGVDSEGSLALLGAGEFGRVLGIGYHPTTDEFSVIVRVTLRCENVSRPEQRGNCKIDI